MFCLISSVLAFGWKNTSIDPGSQEQQQAKGKWLVLSALFVPLLLPRSMRLGEGLFWGVAKNAGSTPHSPASAHPPTPAYKAWHGMAWRVGLPSRRLHGPAILPPPLPRAGLDDEEAAAHDGAHLPPFAPALPPQAGAGQRWVSVSLSRGLPFAAAA